MDVYNLLFLYTPIMLSVKINLCKNVHEDQSAQKAAKISWFTVHVVENFFSNEPRCEKIGLRGFRPGPT